MLEDGKMTTQRADEARNKPLELKLQHDPGSLGPNFVEESRRYLEAKYGSGQVHRADCGSIQRSTWTCNARRTAPCSMGSPHTSGATAGRAIWRICSEVMPHWPRTSILTGRTNPNRAVTFTLW